MNNATVPFLRVPHSSRCNAPYILTNLPEIFSSDFRLLNRKDDGEKTHLEIEEKPSSPKKKAERGGEERPEWKFVTMHFIMPPLQPSSLLSGSCLWILSPQLELGENALVLNCIYYYQVDYYIRSSVSGRSEERRKTS